MLHKGRRTPIVRDMGGFITHPSMPGWLLPLPRDHGHGPLAMVVESVLHPGRVIAMHEHRNDEIISWVPSGVMRHDDRANGPLVVDAHHLMVMNAGRSFWHSEATLPTDPRLRMLQIFVRPEAPDLEPMIQHGPTDPVPPGSWRHLCGPKGSGAPFHLRNSVDFYDIRLEAGMQADFPSMAARDLYFYVFSGAVVAGGKRFTEGEQGLLANGAPLSAKAIEAAVMVAFLIDPRAPCCRLGTVGDTRQIPPPLLGKLATGVLRLVPRRRPR